MRAARLWGLERPTWGGQLRTWRGNATGGEVTKLNKKDAPDIIKGSD